MNDTETNLTDDSLSASKVLLVAREAAGLSQKDVADTLYLSLAYIRYIDSDSMENITQQIFVKGYLRSYAKLVSLDPDAVVKLYDSDNVAQTKEPILQTIRPENVDRLTFTGPVLISGIAGLLGLVLTIIAVWYFLSSDEDKPKSTVPDAVSSALSKSDLPPLTNDIAVVTNLNREANRNETQVLPESIKPILADVEPDMATRDTNLDESDRDVPALDLLDEEGAYIDPSNINIDRSLQGQINFITVDAGGNDQLRFVFSEACWLEVEDRYGIPVFGDLGKVGDDLTINGEAPFKLVIGAPNAVIVSYAGEEIDLAPFITPARTAKLVLGQNGSTSASLSNDESSMDASEGGIL